MDNEPEKTSPQSTPEQKGLFKMIFHHPNFNVVCGIVTIVSLFASIYFYNASIAKPELTYYVSSTRIPILQSGKLDNFTLTYFGNQVTNDLSSAEIQIWNAGKQPITKDDILKTVTLKTQHGERIYKTVISTTRDVVGLDLTKPQEPIGTLPLDWKILEQGDGIKLQIIYAGNVDVPITLDGVIKGQKQGISQYRTTTNFDKDNFKYFIRIMIFSSVTVVVGMFLLLCLLNIYAAKLNQYRSDAKKRNRFKLISIVLVFLPFVILTFVSYYFHTGRLDLIFPMKPPFGF